MIPVFYKRVQGKNLHYLHTKTPAVIAMNHPNAFADPVILSTITFPLRLKYLARGDAFKPGIVTFLLSQIGIVPIFRIQDGGKDGLKKNDDSYRSVNALLKKNNKVIVFAEGLCVQERRLRPLKKGVARMVFGAYEHLNNDKLLVIPVGINYSKPDKLRSNLFYNVGEPIPVKDFIESYRQNPARTQNQFLEVLAGKMKELISHINLPADDEAVYMAEKLCKKDWMKQQQLRYSDLSDQLIVLKQITEKINKASAHQNPALNEFKAEARAYFEGLNKFKLRDWLIDPSQNKTVNWALFIGRCLLLMAGLPLYILGLTGNLLPLYVTNKIARMIAKTREFYASMALGVSMLVFLLNYVLWFLIISSFAPTVLWAYSSCALFVLSGVFSLYYHPFALKTFGVFRILINPSLATSLLQQRKKCLTLINKF